MTTSGGSGGLCTCMQVVDQAQAMGKTTACWIPNGYKEERFCSHLWRLTQVITIADC